MIAFEMKVVFVINKYSCELVILLAKLNGHFRDVPE